MAVVRWGQNPYNAMVLFSIGDYDVTPIPPKHLKQFNYERVTDSTMGTANKFMLSVYDDTGLELEYAISQGIDKCKFQYGYANGKMSKVYSGRITYYDVDFSDGGALINIEGMSEGLAGSFGKPKTVTYEGMTIDKIVDTIAKDEGWKVGKIEPCVPVSDGQYPNKKFDRINLDAVTFIANTLIPYAKSSKSNESGYTIYFDDKEDGVYVNFCTNNWRGEGSSEGESMLEYEFEVGNNGESEVISFNPEYSGLLTAVLGSATVEAQTIDSIKNEMFTVSVDKDSNPSRATLGDKGMPTDNNKSVVGNSSYTLEELQNIAANMWYQNAAQSYPALLEIIGNPNIEPQKYVSVLVILKSGMPHHSSGVYLVSSVVDDITSGTFTSKMSLLRNALTVGVDEGGGINVTASSAPTVGSSVAPSQDTSTVEKVNTSTATPPSSEIKQICDKYIGLPYVFGGKNVSKDGGIDCSGLTNLVLKEMGVDIGHGTLTQVTKGVKVTANSINDLKPGDLLFYSGQGRRIGHVKLYIGNGVCAEAPYTGAYVNYNSSVMKGLVEVRRVL